jgi:predicted TPR repeat methyltransferase
MNEPSEETPRLSFDQLLVTAMALHQRGHLLEADEVYGTLLDACPDHPDVLHYSGVLAHQLGDSEKGLDRIRRAAEATPEHVDVHNNLGNVLADMGRFDEAEAAYRRVIELAPDHADAHNNLGVMRRKKGDLEQAVAEFRKAIQLVPERADAHQNLASALEDAGDHLAASQAWQKALDLLGDQPKVFENLCRSLRKAGRIDRALRVAQQWVRLTPNDPIASHVLAALSGERVPERASDQFVERTFDEFAPSFESILATLEYCVPEMVQQRMRDQYGEPSGELVILDGGCGTGMCAPGLRPFARRLVGVDLSEGMLDQARQRELYDDLVAAELTAFLQRTQDVYDTIVLADTLPYFGDLAALFAAVASCLPAGGCLLFSNEENPDTQPADGYQLLPTGRYSHSRRYVKERLLETGLQPISLVPAVIRKECEEPIYGLLVHARR